MLAARPGNGWATGQRIRSARWLRPARRFELVFLMVSALTLATAVIVYLADFRM